MTYERIWAKTLASGEKVQVEFSIGDRYRYIGIILWGVIGVLGLFLISNTTVRAIIVLFCLTELFHYGYYMKVANAYAFTNKRVLIHRGWLSTHTISVDYSKITDVHITEPFFDRIITHTGNIAINTAGMTADQILVRHIESPYEIKKKLDVLKDK